MDITKLNWGALDHDERQGMLLFWTMYNDFKFFENEMGISPDIYRIEEGRIADVFKEHYKEEYYAKARKLKEDTDALLNRYEKRLKMHLVSQAYVKKKLVKFLTDFQKNHTRIDRMYIQYMAEVLSKQGDGPDDNAERYARMFSSIVCRIMKENLEVFF